VALLAALLSGFVSGLTGFGFALISVPLLLFVYNPTTVVVLTAVLAVFINLAVVWDSWEDIDKRLVLALLFPAFFGTMAGVEVLKAVGPEYIRLGMGVLVVLFALLLVREIRIPGAGTRWGPIVAGSASGALSTSTGLGGPPVVLLLASRGLPKYAFRASSALYFLFISAVGFAVLVFRGLVDSGDVALVLVLVPVALLGKLVGTELVRGSLKSPFVGQLSVLP
jgi:uncharacterized membrane protein YfcA